MAEGPKLLAEALDAGAAVETVFVEVGAAGDAHRHLARRAAGAGAAIVELDTGVLARVSDSVTPQPIAAIVAAVDVTLDRLPLRGVTVVAAGLQDPGNAGAVVRSAAASGSGAVVFCEGAVDIYNPKAVRASAGTLFHLPLCVGASLEDVLGFLADHAVRRVGTAARGGRPHDQVDWTVPTALVLGSESHGLPPGVEDGLDELVSIPMHGRVESLNVAMAATVLCFEAARQRRGPRLGAA